MTVVTKDRALQIIRRAYGPDVAETLADRLPESIDLEKSADIALLARLGLNRERMISALGGEL